MRLTVKIDMDNAAFESDLELGRILRELADRSDRDGLDPAGETLRDVNGNRVGSATMAIVIVD